MWEERAFTDAEVTCDGRSFSVHRTVLAAASPVFSATFRGQMREAATAQLEVVDAPASAVEALLRYIYTGVLEPATAAAVLPVAHRYQIERLVTRCCEELLRCLAPDTAVETVRALRALREDKVIVPFWDRTIDKVHEDKALFRVVLEEVV